MNGEIFQISNTGNKTDFMHMYIGLYIRSRDRKIRHSVLRFCV